MCSVYHLYDSDLFPILSIFLIDHAWTYRVQSARQQLQEIPGLLHRMANLIGIEFHGEFPDEDVVDQVMVEMWKYNQTYQLSQGVREHCHRW